MNLTKRLFFILILILTSLKSFAIEEILPDFKEEETILQKLTAQKEVKLNDEDTIQFGVNFKGSTDFTIYNNDNGRFASSYPYSIEPYIYSKFGEGKYESRIGIVPTRDTSKYDNKVFGIISDIYIIRHLNEKHKVLIGNSRVPIGYEGSTSHYDLPFAQRSQIGSNIGDARSLGVRFMGEISKFDYDVGGYFATRNLQHFNDGGEFVGWLDYSPFKDKKGNVFENLKLGGGLQYGRSGENYTVLSTGAKWNYKKEFATIEYAFAQNYNGHNGFKEAKAQGANITIGHNLTDKLQLVGRYDFFDPDMKKSNNAIAQYSLGINWFIIGKRLRLTLDYIFEQQKNNNKNKIMFMTQFMI